jgi:hypothetical protein
MFSDVEYIPLSEMDDEDFYNSIISPCQIVFEVLKHTIDKVKYQFLINMIHSFDWPQRELVGSTRLESLAVLQPVVFPWIYYCIFF